MTDAFAGATIPVEGGDDRAILLNSEPTSEVSTSAGGSWGDIKCRGTLDGEATHVWVHYSTEYGVREVRIGTDFDQTVQLGERSYPPGRCTEYRAAESDLDAVVTIQAVSEVGLDEDDQDRLVETEGER